MKILKKVGILLVQTDVKCPRSDSRTEYRRTGETNLEEIICAIKEFQQ
jgi:hypothetical protein